MLSRTYYDFEIKIAINEKSLPRFIKSGNVLDSLSREISYNQNRFIRIDLFRRIASRRNDWSAFGEQRAHTTDKAVGEETTTTTTTIVGEVSQFPE